MKRAAHRIRHAAFKDAVAIFILIRNHPRELLPRPISDIVQNIDRFLVCEVRGHIVGVVSWNILPEMGAPKDPTIEIKSLAVESTCQHRGIGRAMVEDAIRHIRRLHPSKIIVLTFHPKFFARFGFRQVPKESLMYKLYAGCINCSKYDSPFTCPEIAMALEPG
jgi:N-acetylglutamate synthase-like GNAT family acetyltransferase